MYHDELVLRTECDTNPRIHANLRIFACPFRKGMQLFVSFVLIRILVSCSARSARSDERICGHPPTFLVGEYLRNPIKNPNSETLLR